ncbi:MAG: hypothetical protein RLZZ215_590 [Pseudomonadota bacterium]|jgi:hypothetical protein
MTMVNEYITIKKFAEISGLTEEAIRQYIKKGIWIKGTHWIKSPNVNRNYIVVKAVNQWIAGTKV